jgi:prepilin-type processing-associated H-X9-DG protein
LSCIIYANDNDGKFPTELNILITEMDIASDTLESPLKPSYSAEPDYILVPGLTTESPPDSILVYTNPAFLCNEINVAYVDGHVEKLNKDAFIKQLERTYKNLNKPMPDVVFGSDR